MPPISAAAALPSAHARCIAHAAIRRDHAPMPAPVPVVPIVRIPRRIPPTPSPPTTHAPSDHIARHRLRAYADAPSIAHIPHAESPHACPRLPWHRKGWCPIRSSCAPALHVDMKGILPPISVGFPAATWPLLELLFGGVVKALSKQFEVCENSISGNFLAQISDPSRRDDWPESGWSIQAFSVIVSQKPRLSLNSSIFCVAWFSFLIVDNKLTFESTMSSSTPGQTATPSDFKSILDAALTEYKKKTGKELLNHPLATEVQRCDSVDAIKAIFQGQAKAFQQFRDGDQRLMKWISPVVDILYTFSGTLGGVAGQAFPPAGVIFTGIGILLAAAKDVKSSHDALVELFERIENFFERLDVYTQISLTTEMAEVFVKIVAEILSILSIATKEVKRKRARIYFRKLLGRTDIEDALRKLDSLIQEEVRMAVAQIKSDTSQLKGGAQPIRSVTHFTLNDCPPRCRES
ncbi:hypothetical protein EDB83DRAFT_2318279 [Lactarius deliciosus]|nr:hypothetical protein EDB83DRAFT_2318279 [Lactarius deliciosus]